MLRQRQSVTAGPSAPAWGIASAKKAAGFAHYTNSLNFILPMFSHHISLYALFHLVRQV